MKANIFGKGKKRKKDNSEGKAGGGRLSGQACHAAEARERPKGRPGKQASSGGTCRSAEDRERPKGRPGKQPRRGASVHDSYFRKVFSKKKYTPDIFKLALPEKLYNLVDVPPLVAPML